MEAITPIEYIQDGYATRDGVIVWRGDSIIDSDSLLLENLEELRQCTVWER
jgi:hypothetical protein